MKIFVILLLLEGIILHGSSDSVQTIPKFDLSKGLNIPGIVPGNLNNTKEVKLLPYEIDAIKQKAKDYIPEPVKSDDMVIMETARGTMKLRLFPENAPKHCENFKRLANSGFYDGTLFHRIIPGFMIQGGDILSRDNDPKNDGRGGPGWVVDAEFNNIPHKRGILSMARSADPNSAGSQFFICVADAPHLDGQYTVFGEVLENVHVVDHIVNTPTEYSQAARMGKSAIPPGEDPDNWISLFDPKKKKKIYSKVPQFMKKADYEFDMRNKITSDRPALPLTIKKVRVLSAEDYKNKENK